MKRVRSRALALLMAVLMVTQMLMVPVYAADTIVHEGYVTYGSTTVGHFTVNGVQAFCLEHAKDTPGSGAGHDGGSIYDDDRIKAALYYGITGDGNIFGSDWTRGTVVTSLVLSAIYSGTSTNYTYSGFQELLALAQAGEYPSNEASFSPTSPSVYVDGTVQRTETITLNAATTNNFTFTLPSAISFYNETTGASQTGGSVTIKGGDKFYLAAALDYEGTYSSGELTGTAKEWSAIVYKTDNSSSQDIGYGAWTDSLTTTSFTARFEARTGDAGLIKTSEDGIVAGLQFRIVGEGVDEIVTTDSSGRIDIELLPGTYTVTEVSTPNRYVQPASETITIVSGQTASVTFSNILKKFNVTLTKRDSETGTSQGDASLAGAVYGIYKGGELVDTYTTDANGQFTTDYYICDTDWTIREITPSEGYLLDNTVHSVGASPGNFTVERNTVSIDVTEVVIKGNVAIIKHSDDGDTGIETPEEGAVFHIYLKSAGSYENAKASERDILVCDKYGYAESKDLPYGVYTITQISGWDGRELIADFDVYISENGETYRYLMNNAAYASYIMVVKVDAETGMTIPYAGAGFQIYDPNGDLVTMTYTYPTVTTIDTFYTNAEGYLVTPEKLEYGTGYTLVEVEAPYGYVLDSTPIPFDVIQENSENHESITVIKIIKSNLAQKGTITVTKTGEDFISVAENEGVYLPVYEDGGQAGAVYEITAAEDITTPDGTVRVPEGELVDTLTTGSDGTAVSTELYLGLYMITEITAPDGFALQTEPVTVEITYAGQLVEVTNIDTDVYNERQRVEIELIKSMESDELFGVGLEDEILSVSFGLYATEDITARDGSVIPEDGLIEVLYLDEYDGHGIFTADLPFGAYYVQEISADEHYILSDTKYPIVFAYEGQDVEIVYITVNSGEEIVNELIRGEVEGLKTDEDGEGLEGALIGLFHPDTEEFTAEAALMTTVSDEDGYFSFTDIVLGLWLVCEIEAPEGYILSDEVFEVEVDADGVVVEITMENTRIRGDVMLVKVDEDYPDNLLEGAEFALYADTNGDGELDEDDELIGYLEETEPGIYAWYDLIYGAYFIKEEKAPEGFLLDENAYYFQIENNGEAVIVENEAGVGFINQAMRGGLRIIKTSADGRKEGFTFRIEGEDYDETFTTDADGIIFIEDLRIGTYVITEVENDISAEYILPDPITVEITYDEIVEVTFYNDKVTVTNVPKTGDDTSLWPWIGLMGLGAAGMTGGIIMMARRRKRANPGDSQ